MSEQVYCPIRKVWIAATPEELVRQKLLSHMIHNLEYPVALLAVEKDLRQIPHLDLTDKPIPDRRADLICFGNNIHPQHSLYPLLLVECKAVKITSRTLNQVIGYNYFLGAYYIAVVNGYEMRTGWYDKSTQEYRFVNHLPTFQELLKR